MIGSHQIVCLNVLLWTKAPINFRRCVYARGFKVKVSVLGSEPSQQCNVEACIVWWGLKYKK